MRKGLVGLGVLVTLRYRDRTLAAAFGPLTRFTLFRMSDSVRIPETRMYPHV
jgi:hypothetical protein